MKSETYLMLLAFGVGMWVYLNNTDQRQLCQRVEAEYKAYQNAVKDARP
jgi:protein-S-isoprenylcysteine O-methyltransferase Ste14